MNILSFNVLSKVEGNNLSHVLNKYIYEEINLIQSLRHQSAKIRRLIEEVNNWEQNTDYRNSVGAIGEIQSKAAKFRVERQTRKKLQNKTSIFISMFDNLLELRSKIEETKKLIKPTRKEMSIAPKPKSKPEPKPKSEPELEISFDKTSLDNFEYYEIKEKGDIKQISSLPDVFGDAGYWRILFNANLDKLKDPLDIIPAGTVLMVPNLNITREFDF